MQWVSFVRGKNSYLPLMCDLRFLFRISLEDVFSLVSMDIEWIALRSVRLVVSHDVMELYPA